MKIPIGNTRPKRSRDFPVFMGCACLVPVPAGRGGGCVMYMCFAGTADCCGERCLMIFPAGEVSAFDWKRRAVEDKPWTPHLGMLVRATKSTVVPVFFPGCNSQAFQALGMIHPMLRKAMLPREFLHWKGKQITMRVGRPVPPAKRSALETDDGLTQHFRIRVEMLGLDEEKRVNPWMPKFPYPSRRRPSIAVDGPAHVADAADPAALAADIAALPDSSLLASQGGLEARVAAAADIPAVLQEIGRLRELTFRAVGEGTGKVVDLDDYDNRYLHLFLWNPATREVAGAYRMGLSEGCRNPRERLYTETLFHFVPGFLQRLGPAIELGRSFVTAAYQRKPHSLFLLWKGIACFVSRNPRYRSLFGPVSISNDYSHVSKSLMVQFLRQHHGSSVLSRWVGARHPFRPCGNFRHNRHRLAKGLATIEDVSAVVADFEADGKGVPVLLRQYVRMNAVLLKFNVDPDFADALDGLMVVDLMTSHPKVLGRYMGEEALAGFHKFHARENQSRKPDIHSAAQANFASRARWVSAWYVWQFFQQAGMASSAVQMDDVCMDSSRKTGDVRNRNRDRDRSRFESVKLGYGSDFRAQHLGHALRGGPLGTAVPAT